MTFPSRHQDPPGRNQRANDMSSSYAEFLADKVAFSKTYGHPVTDDQVNPILKPHQRKIVAWAVQGGRRAIFAAFGLGKSVMQLDTLRLTLDHVPGGRALIVCPLGVRIEFAQDAAMLGIEQRFVRRDEEVDEPGIYVTNYESVRDGRLSPDLDRNLAKATGNSVCPPNARDLVGVVAAALA